jgi:hypothetical protein
MIVWLPAPLSIGGETPGPSSRRTPLAFTEIQYNPADRNDDRNLEFVEVYNSNPWPEVVGGFRIEGELEFEFPKGAIMGPLEYAVVAAEPGAIETEFGIENVFGPAAGRLGNGGGELRLLKPSGAVLLELRYDDHTPWPLSADGTGHSLVLAHPSFGESDPRAWEASAFAGGSPGMADPHTHTMSGLRAIRFNEVHAWPKEDEIGFVEFENLGSEPVDLSNCSIDGTLVSPYTIAAGTTLAPGDFLVVAASEFGPGFAPGAARLHLWSPDKS